MSDLATAIDVIEADGDEWNLCGVLRKELEVMEQQRQTITDLSTALDDALYDLEQCEVLIDSIRGSGRDIREIEQDDDLPISIIEARKVLAKARGQQCE